MIQQPRTTAGATHEFQVFCPRGTRKVSFSAASFVDAFHNHIRQGGGAPRRIEFQSRSITCTGIFTLFHPFLPWKVRNMAPFAGNYQTGWIYLYVTVTTFDAGRLIGRGSVKKGIMRQTSTFWTHHPDGKKNNGKIPA